MTQALPYARRALRWYDYISINIYFLGLTTLSQTNGLLFPLLVQQFVGETNKGAYLGQLRLWTLMVALLMQAVWGLLSDRSTLPGGRRRPFIFIGTLGNLAAITLVGVSAGMDGMGGYWFLFAVAVLSQVASNMSHAAQQGLMPDLVPENKRGIFSGIKAILELPLPLILVSFTVGRMLSAGNMWGAILLAMGVLALSMAIAMLAPEKRLMQKPAPINWNPILRLAGMTAIFTAIILGTGWIVQLIGRLMEGVQSTTTLVLVMGAAGLAAMAVAVGLGVWISVRVSIGDDARRNPSFTWWVVNRLAFLVGAVNLSTFAVYFIQGRLGLEGSAAAGPAANLMLAVGVFILFSALPGGWVADRLGRKPVIAFSGLMAAAGTLVALLSTSLSIIYVGGAMIGIATGLFFTANWALGTLLVPQDQAARYLGISNLAGAGAGAVGAYIGGPIADYVTAHAPDSTGLGYVLLFSIYGVLFLLSVFALLGIQEKRQA